MRQVQSGKEIFLNSLKSLIKKNLVENKNVASGYYRKHLDKYIISVKEFGQYLLDEIEITEHLLEEK